MTPEARLVDAEIWGVDRMPADQDALVRRAKLEEESTDLRATIDRLVEQLKFTW